MRYFIFTRVSTKKQHTENQKLECHEYVNKKKIKGDQVIEYEEQDTSSRIAIQKRAILQSMIQNLDKGDTLVVYKLDRLARKGQELVNLYCDLIDRGVTIYSIYEPNADVKFVHLSAMVAMMERENIQNRTKSGLEKKKKKKERVGTTLFGYKLDETKLSTYAGSRSEGKPYKLINEKNEQDAIKIMLEMHSEGISYGKIQKKLQELGYKNRNNNCIQKSTIYNVVKRLGGSARSENRI